MFRASLLVINGPNRGTRYEIASDQDVVIGRSVGCNGDNLQFGSSVLLFQLAENDQPPVASADQVRFIDDSRSMHESAIVQSVEVDESSATVAEADRKHGLDLLYHVAEELVTPIRSLDDVLQRILNLAMQAIDADRGCVLLKDPVGVDLTAIAFARCGATEAGSAKMPVSRSITDYVLRQGVAVRTSDASQDNRFHSGKSIVTSGIREAICAPMRGRSDMLGVLYLDTTTPLDQAMNEGAGSRLTDEHLRTIVTVARQAALAIESRQFQDAMVKAERFAAMGQTITVLSHHIKNILQGVRGGSYLIRMGLDEHKDELIRQGWGIVERNQTRIYDLVMDMLNYSKDRVPTLKQADVNTVVGDVIELAAARAKECGVKLEFRRGDDVSMAMFDEEGIHRAVLNIVSNAIDAVEGIENGAVVVQTGFDKAADMLLVAVSDNGPGIPEDQRAAIFNVFESSKGSRGTGIGLPVSRKILREHGGRVRVEGGPGQGTRFVLSWPRGNATIPDINRLIQKDEASDH